MSYKLKLIEGAKLKYCFDINWNKLFECYRQFQEESEEAATHKKPGPLSNVVFFADYNPGINCLDMYPTIQHPFK